MITAYQARTSVEANLMRLGDDLERCFDAVKDGVKNNLFRAYVQFEDRTTANETKKKLIELGYTIVINKNPNNLYNQTFTMEIHW